MAVVYCGGREQHNTDPTIICTIVSSAKEKEKAKFRVGANPNASAVYKGIGREVNFNKPSLNVLLDYQDLTDWHMLAIWLCENYRVILLNQALIHEVELSPLEVV